MLSKLRKRAQTTAEYAVLIALVVGAVVAMQVYVKRGIQGRIRNVVDDVNLGGAITADSSGASVSNIMTGDQYEPYYVSSTGSTTQTSSNSEDLKTGGAVSRTASSQVDVSRTQDIGWQGQE